MRQHTFLEVCQELVGKESHTETSAANASTRPILQK